jgi:hypothetical protein
LEKTRSSIDHEAGSATKLEISNPKSETPSGPSSVGDAKNRPGRRDLLSFSMRAHQISVVVPIRSRSPDRSAEMLALPSGTRRPVFTGGLTSVMSERNADWPPVAQFDGWELN